MAVLGQSTHVILLEIDLPSASLAYELPKRERYYFEIVHFITTFHMIG